MRTLILILFITLSTLFAAEKHFTLGRDPYWTPLTFGEKTLDVNLFSDKLIEGIAESEGTQITIVDMGGQALLNALDSGCVDGILTTLSSTPETSAKYNFSTPFFMAGPVLVVRADSKATSISDLKGRNVLVYAYDRTVLLVQKYPTIVIKNYTCAASALEDVANGLSDAALIPTVEAHALIWRYHEKLKIATAPLTDTSLKLVTLKGKQRPLLLTFNRGLKKIKKTGLYALLRLEYNVN